LIPRAPFIRLVRDVANSITGEQYKWRGLALVALQVFIKLLVLIRYRVEIELIYRLEIWIGPRDWVRGFKNYDKTSSRLSHGI